LSLGQDDWAKKKDDIVHIIRSNGGTVFDDWSAIFPMQGKHFEANTRWVMKKEDFQCTVDNNIDRVFSC